MKYTLVMLLIVALFTGSTPGTQTTQAAPVRQDATGRTFPETGYRVSGRFLQFWDSQGGLPVFGLPISDQHPQRNGEGIFDVQWFERERFELHPENTAPYDILLGRLGDETLRHSGRDWQTLPPEAPRDGCLYFEQTRRNLCEPFLSYWRSYGLEFDGQPGPAYAESLALFGLPLTTPAMETNSSGQTVLTQWFERARFEYLPDNRPDARVLLGRLGAERFAPGRTSLDPRNGSLPDYHSVTHPGWPTPLEVPAGFTVEEAASGLRSPRFMALDRDGSLVYASHNTKTVVRLQDQNGDGFYEIRQTIADDLPFVHSIAIIDGQLYAAAENRVVRLSNFDHNGKARSIQTIIEGIPDGARDLYGHRTRTLLPGTDGMLYLSVGSSCDICEGELPQRAAILRISLQALNQTTKADQMERFASGLRNTVGLAFRPFTSELWGVDMGRNNLGLDQPPEELNLIQPGKNYGWPYCFANRQPDPMFNDTARCATTEPPRYTFPAHWAPLGIVFYDQAAFPASYYGDALVASHGSAADQTDNARLGYRVVRVRFQAGQPVAHEDLLRGFTMGKDAWARPTGLLVMPDGSILVSDDQSGYIFRIRYNE